MAHSVSSQLSPYVDKLIVDTTANATAETSIFSGAAANIFIIDIDNTGNSSTVTAKLYDNANPTIDGSNSSTEPDIILTVPKQSRQTVTVDDGINFGSDFSFACTSGASTTNNTSPTSAVTMRIMAESCKGYNRKPNVVYQCCWCWRQQCCWWSYISYFCKDSKHQQRLKYVH